MSTIRYALLTLKHKWFVLVAGLRFGVPLWRLITHDWTKLLPRNLRQYGRQFFGDMDDALGFAMTWNRHQNAHDHHWEYWIPRTGHNHSEPPYPDNEPLPMPEAAMREMVADWYGASRAYEGKWPTLAGWVWLRENFHEVRLHPATRARIEELLEAGLGGFPAGVVCSTPEHTAQRQPMPGTPRDEAQLQRHRADQAEAQVSEIQKLLTPEIREAAAILVGNGQNHPEGCCWRCREGLAERDRLRTKLAQYDGEDHNSDHD